MAENLEIGDILGKRPWQVSGGERRRAELLLALSGNPSLLLLDEPTSMLDPESAKLVIKAISEVSNNKPVIVASHDWRLEEVSSKIIKLASR